MIHHLSDVKTQRIGYDTHIWQYAVVLEDVVIGNNCNICSHTFIDNNVVIGNNVTIKNGVYLWDGITLEDDVFVGPCVAFTNDLFPRSRNYKKPLKTVVKRGASIGANASILCGLIIGEYSLIGLSSVVTRDVPSYAVVYGNPATIKGWVNEKGQKLYEKEKGIWVSHEGDMFKSSNDGLIKI